MSDQCQLFKLSRYFCRIGKLVFSMHTESESAYLIFRMLICGCTTAFLPVYESSCMQMHTSHWRDTTGIYWAIPRPWSLSASWHMLISTRNCGLGICAHPSRDCERGTTYNYLISKGGVMSVFALHNEANPVKLLWKTAIPCTPCYIHSLAISQKYVIFIRNVRYLPPVPFHAKFI